MMRMASVFSKLKRPLTGGALLFMAGCAGGQAANVQDALAENAAAQSGAEPDSFTTKGKPTKTIETPWGPREIYDPAQDCTLRNILDAAYDRGDVTFSDVTHGYNFGATPPPAYPGLNYAVQAHTTSYLDLKRLGCKVVDRLPCASRPQPYFEAPTGLEDLGTTRISARNSKLWRGGASLGRVWVRNIYKEDTETARWSEKDLLPEPIGRDNTGPSDYIYGSYQDTTGCQAHGASPDGKYQVEHGGIYIGNKSDYNKDETFEIVTGLICSVWSSK